MNKFALVLILSLALLSSTIVGTTFAGSESKIVKSIKKDAGSFKKVCEVWIKDVNNKELHKVYVKSNSVKCGTAVPPTPVNQPPVLVVDSPIKCVAGLECTLTVEASDPDGNITQIIYNQESGPSVGNITNNFLSAVFVPPVNSTYVFSVEAQDNNGSATLKPITVNVGQVTPPPPLECPDGQHEENGQCVDDPKPPVGNVTEVILAGDFGGSAVSGRIVTENPNVFVALGDLFYGSDLSKYNSFVSQLRDSINRCVIGNHDSNEDGSGAIIAQAVSACGDSVWTEQLPFTLLVGFNSNGDIPKQVEQVKAINYSSYKNVIVVSHKPCDVFPNAHHPLNEDKSVADVCNAVKESAVGKNVILVSGHNHNLAKKADGSVFVSGAGGRSHYVCGKDANWTFCNSQTYGYLKLEIDNNTGNIKDTFLDTNGNIVTLNK